MATTPRLYDLLEQSLDSHTEPSWQDLLPLTSSSEEAQFIHPETGLTPLHLAVMSRDSSSVCLDVIESLLETDLSATEEVCTRHGFTPLMYACQTKDLACLESDARIVSLLMEYNVDAFSWSSLEGHSTLDIHILAMSALESIQTPSTTTTSSSANVPCTSVLRVLLGDRNVGVLLPRTLDFLLSCNSLEVLERVALVESRAFMAQLAERRQARGPSGTNPNATNPAKTRNAMKQHPPSFWVWEFVVEFLRCEHEHTFAGVEPMPPFDALHTACQMDDFPPAFLMLCKHAYPEQVSRSSLVHGGHAVHAVASWDVVGCRSKACRKSIALTELLTDHPASARARNDQGKTPLTLAIESGTSWNGGVSRLTQAQKDV
eukprot:Nitzschia sp. Nitz4//scaffold44_size153857//75247//76371//NITZ4_002725-RA/size153857-processed-gene-0.125-mRNA-1//1//CDS//3329552169//632//frame0